MYNLSLVDESNVQLLRDQGYERVAAVVTNVMSRALSAADTHMQEPELRAYFHQQEEPQENLTVRFIISLFHLETLNKSSRF